MNMFSNITEHLFNSSKDIQNHNIPFLSIPNHKFYNKETQKQECLLALSHTPSDYAISFNGNFTLGRYVDEEINCL